MGKTESTRLSWRLSSPTAPRLPVLSVLRTRWHCANSMPPLCCRAPQPFHESLLALFDCSSLHIVRTARFYWWKTFNVITSEEWWWALMVSDKWKKILVWKKIKERKKKNQKAKNDLYSSWNDLPSGYKSILCLFIYWATVKIKHF